MSRIAAESSRCFAAGLLCSAANAQDTVIKKVAARPTVALDGKTLFNQYCAVCHGIDGKGAGPAAPALKQRPTDLTQFSSRNNRKFPEERILTTLKGAGVSAHGSADMPVWGPIFGTMSPSLNQAQDRIHGLMNYLEQMQSR